MELLPEFCPIPAFKPIFTSEFCENGIPPTTISPLAEL